MNIDWDKSPEGTTHVFLGRGYLEWRKLRRGRWFAFGGKDWEPIVGRPDHYIARGQSK